MYSCVSPCEGSSEELNVLGEAAWKYKNLYFDILDQITAIHSKDLNGFLAFAATIEYLTLGETFHALAKQYGIPKSSMKSVIMTVIDIINTSGKPFEFNEYVWNASRNIYKKDIEFPQCLGFLGKFSSKVATNHTFMRIKFEEKVQFFAIVNENKKIYVAETLLGQDKEFTDTVMYKKLNVYNLFHKQAATSPLTTRFYVSTDVVSPFNNLSGARTKILPYDDPKLRFLQDKFLILKRLNIVYNRDVDEIFQACVNLHNFEVEESAPAPRNPVFS